MNINETEKEKLLMRLRTTRGHMAAIERMIEEDKDYNEIIPQLVAVRSAIIKVLILVAQNHVSNCVTEAFEKEAGPEAVNKAIESLIKIHHGES